MSQLPEEIDRLLLVSRQPDQRRALAGLAKNFTAALARVRNKEGLLIAQLDELLEPYSMLVADQQFMPSEPVALCLTGSPRLVAATYSGLLSVTKARFVRIRPASGVGGLRVFAVAQDGRLKIDAHRESAAVDLDKLVKSEWQVEPVREEGPAPAMVETEATLRSLSGKRPTPYAPPCKPAEQAHRSPRAKPGGIFAGLLRTRRRKSGKR